MNALRLATRNLPEPTVARLLDAIEWHLASQLARGAKQDYALAVALALGNTRHANLDPHVCERVAQLQYQLAQQLAQEP